jgi:hypothetical protein
MRTIYKYVLCPHTYQTVEMPVGAKILTAQLREGRIYVWAEVRADAPLQFRPFWICGTGENLYHMTAIQESVYVATVQQGEYVRHIYTAKG